MSQERENYCRLIGLNPYREDRYSPGEINKRIDAAETAWKKEQKSPASSAKKKHLAGTHLAMVADMHSVMSSDVLREEEFAEGRVLLESKASKLNRDVITLHDGSLFLIPGSEDGLAKKLKWNDVDGKTILEASKIKSVPIPKPADDDIVSAFEKLSDLGLYSSAELINTLTENPAIDLNVGRLDAGSRPEEIRGAFGAAERKLSTMMADRIENQDAYIQAMRALKVVLHPDEKLAAFDRYGRCMRAMEPAILTMDEDYSQPFSNSYIRNLLSIYGTYEGIDSEMAVAILERHCCRKHYIANFSSNNSRLTICARCKAIVADGRDAEFCPVCGGAMHTVCPRCGTAQPSSHRNCIKCGSELEGDLREVRRERLAIERLLDAGDISGAEAEFRAMTEKYPKSAGKDGLEKRISETAAEYRKILDRIKDDCKLRNFYSIKTAVEDALPRFPKIKEDGDVAGLYSEACENVKEADAFCDRAEESEEDGALNFYIRAADRCSDHPRAVRRLRDYPPEGPADAKCAVREGTVLIKFAIPADSKNMSFCIFRGRNSLPEVGQSTVPLTEIPGCVFQDKTPDPGVDYYYKIYSKRWGILSRDFTQCGPAMVLSEVEGVSIDTVEDGLRITYPIPRGCSRVRIWRKEDGGRGEETEIVHGNTGTVLDRNLKGDTGYNYLFVAEYDVNGRTERSLGTVASGKTPKYPDPVDDMEIVWNRTDGSYSARWGSSEKVDLYASLKKTRILGNTVSIEDVERWMTRIVPDEEYEKGCRFEIPDGAVVYIHPMIRIGSTAVRGREVMITNLRPFRDVEKRMNGGDCDLLVTWPDGAEAAAVTVRDPDTGDGPEKTEEITVSRELYEKDGRIRIQMGMSNKKTVTLRAVYDVEGEKAESIPFATDVYSGSSTKIKYSVHEEKVKEDRNLVRIIIDFESTDGDSVPRVAMAAASVGIPLRLSDGETVWDSEDPVVLQNGRAQTWFTMDRARADIHRMRLFFADRDEYGRYKLIHPLYGREG